MHVHAEKPKVAGQASSARAILGGGARMGHRHEEHPLLPLQRAAGNQAGERRTEGTTGDNRGGAAAADRIRFGNDVARMSGSSRVAGLMQMKLAINAPGDRYEQEADRISEQVMRMDAPQAAHTAPPAIERLGAGFQTKTATAHLQRHCAECEKEKIQRSSESINAGPATGQVEHEAETKVNAVSGGVPLSHVQRDFFEPRFGADFSQVRVHTGSSADTAARAVGAYAYTRGSDIVFRSDQYNPDSAAGGRLLAHELTHVVQQGAAPLVQRRAVPETAGPQAQSGLQAGGLGRMVQRWPGDGMEPPGDCGWGNYLLLRGSVETAKVVVSMLGACSAGDSCLTLATKIAAITAEIAARVALAATCFKGGDTGHRQQVQNKINMVNRCYRFFSTSNCPQPLIAQMAVVVEQARAVIAAGAVVVAAALVVALIAAIIALAEVIAALLVAAAESAAVVATVEAVMALLVALRGQLAS